MSTYQPPGGPPEGTPGYAPPQDPWAGGYEPGLASVPTDPIPQPYDPYAAYPQGDVWSQQTVAHGGPYGYVPQQPQKSRAGVIVLVFLVVLLLGGGGGFAAWYVIKKQNATADPSGSASPSTSSSQASGFDPYAVREGDCLVNQGTQTEPEVAIAPCATEGSFKVIRIVSGVNIQENDQGVFDDKVTSVAACKDTTYQSWYGYQDAVDDARDLFFCMTNN